MTALSVRYAASMVGPCVCDDNDFRQICRLRC
jgi:hypothetical protein